MEFAVAIRPDTYDDMLDVMVERLIELGWYRNYDDFADGECEKFYDAIDVVLEYLGIDVLEADE